MRPILLVALFIVISSCKKREVDSYVWKEITVKSSAYNSLKYQTDSNPSIAAWGDSLIPGMRSVAVSRDLIRLGLKHNTPIKIEGLDSIYLEKIKCIDEKETKLISIWVLMLKKQKSGV